MRTLDLDHYIFIVHQLAVVVNTLLLSQLLYMAAGVEPHYQRQPDTVTSLCDVGWRSGCILLRTNLEHRPRGLLKG